MVIPFQPAFIRGWCLHPGCLVETVRERKSEGGGAAAELELCVLLHQRYMRPALARNAQCCKARQGVPHNHADAAIAHNDERQKRQPQMQLVPLK